MTKTLLLILSLSFLSTPAWACNALRGKAFRPDMKVQDSKEMKIDPRLTQSQNHSITHEDVAAIVPLNMRATSDSNIVRDAIIRRSSKSLADSDLVQQSRLLKTVRRLEQQAKMTLALATGKKPATRNAAAVKPQAKGTPAQATPPVFQETEHKFKFDVRPFRGRARMVYRGYVDSQIQYQAENNQVTISLQEELTDNSRVALSHDENNQESRQFLHYHLTW